MKMFLQKFLRKRGILNACLLALSLSGCNFFDQAAEGDIIEAAEPVARVKDNYLYPADITGLVPAGSSAEDSVQLINRYLQNWVRKQLLLNEAANNVTFDQQEIERKILDYRYALISYEYKKQYINQHLSLDVSEQETQAYYDQNKDNFVLKQNIIRGIYIKLPKEAPRINKLRDYLKLNEEDDLEKLRSYCYRFATDFLLDENTWVNFDELITNTPLAAIPNKVQWLQQNKFVETSDNEYLYFLKIREYKISNELSPIDFVREQIDNIIINKRKIELANRLEEEIYTKAQAEDAFEIYE